MKRWGAFAIAVAAIAAGAAQPAVAASPDGPCDGASCGKPYCYDTTVRARPNLNRALIASCSGTEHARLVSAPGHIEITDVSTDFYGVHFRARPDDDAPRWNTAVFDVDGHAETARVEVSIEVVPTAENKPPRCYGDTVSRRTPGDAPVEVYINPWCYDPDEDDFVMEGGGPGTHPDSPKSVPAGFSEANWRYRTATSAGTETATVWATDVLGARSNDAELKVTIGPGVDRPPDCGESTFWTGGPVPVYARPGQVRRFGIYCSDADGDLFEPVMSSPPARGLLVPVPGEPRVSSYWGAERWVDATYTPQGDGTEPDPFDFTPVGVRGNGPTAHRAIVPRPPPENSGGGCSYSTGSIVKNLAGTLSISCSDSDGDPISVEVLTPPKHGTTTEAVITPDRYGEQRITIPYVPEAGYEGYDCIKVRVGDGYGFGFDILIDIWVVPPPPDPPPLPELPEGPDLPGLPPGPPLPPVDPPLPELPSATHGPRPAAPVGVAPFDAPPGAPPGAPPPAPNSESVRSLAAEALGTPSVKRVRAADGIEVWARSKLSKRELLRTGQAPALTVVCLVDCQIKSDAVLTGLRALKAASRKTVVAKDAGQAHLVTLGLDSAEKRALRRARRPRATFKLNVRAAGGKARVVRRSIPIGR